MRIGKHMTAERLAVDPHDVYTIHDKHGETLGFAEWYPKWKQYVFQPDQNGSFSADCLRDLAMFLSKCKRWDATPKREIHLHCPSCSASRESMGFHVRGQFCSCGWRRDAVEINSP